MRPQYTVAVTLRCSVCSGRSTHSGEVDPRGRRWMCPNHGADGVDDGDPFHETGVGTIGDEFEVVSWDVVEAEPELVDASLALDEQDFDVSDDQRFDDLRRMDYCGESAPSIAADRGVLPSTVRDGAMRARRALGV